MAVDYQAIFLAFLHDIGDIRNRHSALQRLNPPKTFSYDMNAKCLGNLNILHALLHLSHLLYQQEKIKKKYLFKI